jgi:hypothetical protein
MHAHEKENQNERHRIESNTPKPSSSNNDVPNHPPQIVTRRRRRRRRRRKSNIHNRKKGVCAYIHAPKQ